MYVMGRAKATTYHSAELDGKKIMAAFLSVKLGGRLAAVSADNG